MSRNAKRHLVAADLEPRRVLCASSRRHFPTIGGKLGATALTASAAVIFIAALAQTPPPGVGSHSRNLTPAPGMTSSSVPWVHGASRWRPLASSVMPTDLIHHYPTPVCTAKHQCQTVELMARRLEHDPLR
ncbi:hypothetical protein [Pedococcus sp. 5OH_020]|uniref:hypothetical protein n=1 Tax=Pedococcus sp. 5OH_020 TaxID=2989814 RepID=UPI0022E9B078|nr:hypothetical protein [Pedococcus sp. 5OH_020]